LYKTDIEGTILDVCESCLGFGEGVIEEKPIAIEKKEKIDILVPYKEEEIFFIENYGDSIIEARKKKNLTREEFAEKIKEKESVIRRVENEEMVPDEILTEKIEKFLEIKLTKIYEAKKIEKTIKKTALTIGDIIEVK
jgi:uncharacterized protein (TIGR00270 family)